MEIDEIEQTINLRHRYSQLVPKYQQGGNIEERRGPQIDGDTGGRIKTE